MFFYFNELTSYMDLSDEDAGYIRSLEPILTPHIDHVVELFYEALEANPRTWALFSGPEQVERLKETLRGWLAEILEGNYDHDYFKRRQRIGRVHVEVGLLPHFMFGAMNIIRRELDRVLYENGTPFDAQQALHKVLDLELAIMVQSYCDTLVEMKAKVPAALASGLAHEIRNPLNAIGLHMTLVERHLRKRGVESDATSTSIEGVRHEVRRLRGLTSEIIDFAKPLNIQPQWVDGADMLQAIETVHRPTLKASRIALETRIEGGTSIYCDPELIKQVLIALLTNSVEALEAAGRVTLSLHNNPRHTMLVFEDTGPGIPAELKFKIFDLFFTTKASGTGMGLPIAQKIINAHGGSMVFEPVSPQGTRFRILLPRPHLDSKE